MTTLYLPEDITVIGYGVFSGCSALKEVTLPAGLQTLGADAFSPTTIIYCHRKKPLIWPAGWDKWLNGYITFD